MKVWISVLLTISVVYANAQPFEQARGEDIQLQCYGQAEKTTLQSRSGYEWDEKQHKFVPKLGWETGKTNQDASIVVSIHDDQGSIHIPKSLIPPLNSGGSDDGWWRINDLIVGHNQIRGRFQLNGLNKPTLSIDRRSGDMTIEGLMTFNGRCEADDGHRKF
ncbi:MAG: hypothetical protein ACOH2S_26295 [Janthinobacterium svalbardensis]